MEGASFFHRKCVYHQGSHNIILHGLCFGPSSENKLSCGSGHCLLSYRDLVCLFPLSFPFPSKVKHQSVEVGTTPRLPSFSFELIAPFKPIYFLISFTLHVFVTTFWFKDILEERACGLVPYPVRNKNVQTAWLTNILNHCTLTSHVFCLFLHLTGIHCFGYNIRLFPQSSTKCQQRKHSNSTKKIGCIIANMTNQQLVFLPITTFIIPFFIAE